MRKDIIKGIRWALVFSVVAIASIGVDRMIRSTPAHAKPMAELPVVVVPRHEAQVPVPEPPILKTVPAQFHASTGAKPAPVTVKMDTVPLPPSLPPLAETAAFAPAPPLVMAAVRKPETRVGVVDPPVPALLPEPTPERVTNYVETVRIQAGVAAGAITANGQGMTMVGNELIKKK